MKKADVKVYLQIDVDFIFFLSTSVVCFTSYLSLPEIRKKQKNKQTTHC